MNSHEIKVCVCVCVCVCVYVCYNNWLFCPPQGAEGTITAIARPDALPKDGLNSSTHHHVALLKGSAVQLLDLRMLKWPLLVWPFVCNAFDMPYHQYQGVKSSGNGVSYFGWDIKLSLKSSSRGCRPAHLIHTLPATQACWHATRGLDNSGAIICGMEKKVIAQDICVRVYVLAIISFSSCCTSLSLRANTN